MVATFETMASFMLVEHANGAMFDPPLRAGARFAGVPTWFSRTRGRVAGPAPQLGADTAEVLAELGMAPDAEEAAAHGSA